MTKYELKIDLNVLNHLGLNLYSNVPAVLSELIANAWDADSTEVKITISKDEISIADNGCGMNEVDLNSKFLNVGYQRRKEPSDDLTPKLKRKVMGRKGIGKLSIFSIAEHIEVYTKKESTLGISMKVDDIRKKIEKKESYHPKEISIVAENEINPDTGTRIVLKSLKKRVASSIDKNMKKRVARRFDIWSDKFKVFINNEEISIEDRDYFHKLEFAITYGDYSKDNFSIIDGDKLHTRTALSLEGGSVSGWIGLVKESGGLQDGSDNLNKISVLARGKVALEDILELYREGGLYTKFLIGEVRADFLDVTGKEDIATSSRQDFIQNDERFIKLKNFIFEELKFIQKARADYKMADGAEKAEEIPEIKEWLGTLKGDTKASAKKLFGRINLIATDEEHRKTLYKHGVLAFEHLHHKEKLQQLDDLDAGSLEIAVQLFSELDDIEASWYYQITEGRLEVIRKLKEHIRGDELEKIIQKHIYDHLWLLDPSWDRATEIPVMEKSIKDELDKLRLTKEEKKGRFDIRYRKISGKHIIIELKRDSVNPKIGELLDQVKKYKKAVKKQLRAHNEEGSIEVICLVGSGLSEWEDPESKQNDEQSLLAQDIRVISYQQLIKDAENSYQDYLNTRGEKGRIQELLQAIDSTSGQEV